MVRAKDILTYAASCVAAALIAACFVTTAGAEQTTTAIHGRAYMFRGLIGMIDWGMDQLAQRIDRVGVAADIEGYSAWRSVATQAIADYRRDPKPITAIGHSIGGDSAVQFAEALEAAHIPVSLLITYDPTRAAPAITANVPATTSKTAPRSSTSISTSSTAFRSNWPPRSDRPPQAAAGRRCHCGSARPVPGASNAPARAGRRRPAPASRRAQ